MKNPINHFKAFWPDDNLRNRMTHRYNAIIKWNKHIFDGKRVLDLASHDGRWSILALEAGADHVTGIEARLPLVSKGTDLFDQFSVPTSSYEFIVGDIHDVIPTFTEVGQFDIVMCLGFLYHTPHPQWLLEQISRLCPDVMILDTKVSPLDDPIIVMSEEPTNSNLAAWNGNEPTALISMPTLSALKMMIPAAGFESVEFYDWPSELATEWAGCGDYKNGERITAITSR